MTDQIDSEINIARDLKDSLSETLENLEAEEDRLNIKHSISYFEILIDDLNRYKQKTKEDESVYSLQ